MPVEPICKLCEDSGWIPITQEGIRSVKDCECKRIRILEYRLRRAGLPERYQRASFETFDPHMGSSVEAAFLISQKFVEKHLLERSKGILFTGPCGVGKTHLAIAIARELTLRYGAECFFTDVRDLLKTIQGTFNTVKGATESDVLRPVLCCPIVILDELGAARSTDWSADVIEHVINTRYNDNLCTLVTTNLANEPPATPRRKLGAIEPGSSFSPRGSYGAALQETPMLFAETLGDRIGSRMFSRLQEMVYIVPMQGLDFRRQRKEIR